MQDLTHDAARRHVIAGQAAHDAAAPADDDGPTRLGMSDLGSAQMPAASPGLKPPSNT
jgi:hypothetical protein